MNHALTIKRYLIIGASGSGKSSMAKAVAEICSIPCIETDALYWQKNWVLRNENDVVDELSLDGNWVMDGSFRGCHERVWPHATSIVWLDLSPYIILPRIIKRNLGWWIRRKPIWSRNVMTLNRAISGIQHARNHLKQIQQDFPEFLKLYPDKNIHILTTPKECAAWLQNLKREDLPERRHYGPPPSAPDQTKTPEDNMKYRNITYPPGLTENLGIGITAPSSGLGTAVFINRFELVSKQLANKGYNIAEGKCLREDNKHVSGTHKERADDLLNLWKNPTVDAIIPPWGGEVLIEILDLIDFEHMMNSPARWILGYSDISTLLFALTLKTGIATAHGINFMDLIATQNDPLSSQTLEILKLTKGAVFTQHSSEKYQTEFTNFSDDLETTYNLTKPTEWKILGGEASGKFSGRLIGGCIDTISHLVGTSFGDMAHFADTFRQDGIIIYLENCELSPCALTRALRQMRMANWFVGATGIVFGRNSGPDTSDISDLSYLDALANCMKGLNIPIVYDADIGHKPPNMTLINGAMAELSVENGKATLCQSLI